MAQIDVNATYLIRGDLLQSICTTAKSKSGTSEFSVADLPTVINSISGGAPVLSKDGNDNLILPNT